MAIAADAPQLAPAIPAFVELFAKDAKPMHLDSGHKWLEGPVWLPSGEFICSDIWADTMYRFDGRTLVVWRAHSGQANGNTLDLQGRVITCQHAPHAVIRTEKDGSITMLVDSYQGKPLSSPNDVVVKSDGSIWFTDPIYGLNGRPRAQAANRVYRYDPDTKQLAAVWDKCDQPNGLCFTPDEKSLYIADSGGPHHVIAVDVVDGKTLANQRPFADISPGVPDGIRCDAKGRLWVCAGDGVHVYGPDRQYLGKVLLHRTVSNCAFGGADGRTLWMTSADQLWSIQLSP